MLVSKFIKVKEHKKPIESEPHLDFDPMMDPKKMTPRQVVQATSYFLTIVEQKKRERKARSEHHNLDRFLKVGRRV